jgi:hypothetical protein
MLKCRLHLDKLQSIHLPMQLLEPLQEIFSSMMPNTKVIVPQETLMTYLLDKGIDKLFFELYIKDNSDPLQFLAQILVTH